MSAMVVGRDEGEEVVRCRAQGWWLQLWSADQGLQAVGSARVRRRDGRKR